MLRCLLLDALADCDALDDDDDDDDDLELQAASVSAAAARAAALRSPSRRGRGRKVMDGTARLLDGWAWSGTEPGPARVAGRLRLQTLPRPGPAIGMAAGGRRGLGFDPAPPPAASVVEAVGRADPGEQDVSGPQPVGEAVDLGVDLPLQEEV